MTALGVLSLCAARGVRLVLEGGHHITLEGPKAARDEVRETIRAVKPEVVTLLRDGRRAEVSTGFAQAFARLGNLYDGDLVGSLWARIVAEHPALGHAIDTTEIAADGAALAYQRPFGNTALLMFACSRSTSSLMRRSRSSCRRYRFSAMVARARSMGSPLKADIEANERTEQLERESLEELIQGFRGVEAP